jgi:hypothetical protein
MGPFEVTDDNLFLLEGGRDNVKWLICDLDGSKSWSICLSVGVQAPTGLNCYEAELYTPQQR